MYADEIPPNPATFMEKKSMVRTRAATDQAGMGTGIGIT